MKLKKKLAQQEVLERVIKTRYKTLSKTFAESSSALEKLAHERINEKKKKKKIVKDYNNIWRVAMHLKKKVMNLRLRTMSLRPLSQPHATLETLAEVAIHYNNPEANNNPTSVPELEQGAEASKDRP
jgi:chromosome segregation and condensation protein ScpB